MTTSATRSERDTRRTWWFVYGVWAVLSLQMLAFVIRYPHAGPIVDEWEFIPAITGAEPFWPWLWKLHNEHRFPLPRLMWFPLTVSTQDFRTGTYITWLGVSLITLLMIDTARRLRGRLHYADAFFPLSLLHVGHHENLLMGYQICFMMIVAFASILLRVILLTNRDNLAHRGLQAGGLTLLLLGCGAGGLAYGPPMALWVFWILFADKPSRTTNISRALLLGLIAAIPVYIALYMHGYERPEWHPDAAEQWGMNEALWRALHIALQTLSMAFGPGVIGLWPVSGLIVGFVCFECVLILVRIAAANALERPRALGLLMFLGALAVMAAGVGWGRAGFTNHDMGLVSRYAWIAWPALGAIYFMMMIYGNDRLARWGPKLLMWIMVAMLPFNVGTGFWLGEKALEKNKNWEQSVRQGLDDEQLIKQYYDGYAAYMKERMRTALHLLRKHRIQYYRPLKEDSPAPPQRGVGRKRHAAKGEGIYPRTALMNMDENPGSGRR